MLDLWSCQYMPLDYMDNTTFSGMIKEIDMGELSLVTVVIPINQSIKFAFLLINDSPILVAKRGEVHRYLGIFLSTEGFSKLSLA
ncbi:hypothetical protein G9A89_019291 [Geosiphon pyriformis]|nr:hypothetical protein G9A89_019291 [Geosiphon pyriformis]